VAGALNIADRRVLRRALIVALLLHATVLIWAHYWLQGPSLLKKLPPPFYTRVLYPQAARTTAPTPPVAHRPVAVPRKRRAVARIEVAPVVAAAQSVASDADPTASAPEPGASVADTASEPTASEPAAAASAASAPTSAASAQDAAGAASAAAPNPPASAVPPAFFDTWPPNTRLTYVLTGNYRGELHGSAWVSWQRLFDGQQPRYQAEVQLNLGLLLSMRLTSQGQMTEQGLTPEIYEEQIGQHRRHLRIGEDIQLNNGKHVPRPDAVQDTASQFIELAHRFATGQMPLTPGGSVYLWLARPTGVDPWVYDVLGEETLYLPRLDKVRAIHIKPRRLNASNGPINAEIWFAPSLQYLPVRILLTRSDDTSVDLMVDTIEQQ
jgi:hypothetical protein